MACYNPERGLCVRVRHRDPPVTEAAVPSSRRRLLLPCPSAFTHSYMYLCDFDIVMSTQSLAELRIAVIEGADRRGCRCYNCKQVMSKASSSACTTWQDSVIEALW